MFLYCNEPTTSLYAAVIFYGWFKCYYFYYFETLTLETLEKISVPNWALNFGKSGLFSSFFFLDCGITGSGVNKKHIIFFSPQWKFEVPSNLQYDSDGRIVELEISQLPSSGVEFPWGGEGEFERNKSHAHNPIWRKCVVNSLDQ